MMIFYPKIYATCKGSYNAINKARELRKENKYRNVYVYKEILHNDYVIKELEKENIFCIDNLDKVKKDDIVIIRAHGETKETFDYLDKRNINYCDATCVNVKNVHKIVIEKYRDYKIIIVGKKDHPEVIGTNGWINNEGIIIYDKEDYNLLNKKDKYFVVSQTTASIDKFNSLIKYLSDNNYNFEYKNTICNMQKLIQSSSVELAKNMDIMFVIGGNNSSNTKVLFDECKEVCKSYYFSNLLDFYEFIKKENITNKMKIGFTGGASTLKEQIKEYVCLLEFMIYYKNKYKELMKELKKYNKSITCYENRIINDAVNKFTKMNSDGKLLRGCLIDLGYKLKKKDNYANSLAVAYETFETSILIHDDIIDKANLRRGKETIHNIYNSELEKYKSNTSIHTDLALCIGDLGFYLTSKLINKKYGNDKNYSKIVSYYNDIVIKTIKGEILDVYLPFIEQYNKDNILYEDDILEIYKLKTATYSVVGPFILGMILGNNTNKDIEKMSDILENLGIAFQIKDDILGIFSKKEIIGKSVFSDIEEFKQTILYAYIKINKKEYYQELLKYYGKKNITKEDNEKVKDILRESGALEYANKIMEELFFKSKEEIEELNIKDDIKNILLGFITYLEIREK